jgi:hypothetical protein
MQKRSKTDGIDLMGQIDTYLEKIADIFGCHTKIVSCRNINAKNNSASSKKSAVMMLKIDKPLTISNAFPPDGVFKGTPAQIAKRVLPILQDLAET